MGFHDGWPPIQEEATAFADSAVGRLSTTQETTQNKTKDRPNLLIFLTDDQRFDQMGCAGHPTLQTPNMDALASAGIRFSNAFVSTPICAASRASLMTGRREGSHGFTFGKPPMGHALAEDTFFAHLRRAGYRTGFVGKWGVKFADDATGKLFDLFLPMNQPYLIPGKPHLTDRIAKASLDFLHGEGPFCLMVSFWAPHAEDSHPQQYLPPKDLQSLFAELNPPPPADAETGFQALPEFLKKSLGRKRWHWRFDSRQKQIQRTKDYWRMISGVDRAIGTVVDELKKRGLEDRTTIIFTSDNGYFLGERGLAGKWLIYEESIRVPFLLFDPNLPPKLRGTDRQEMVLNLDLAPTILEIASLEVPPSYQGRSLLPFLRGEEPSWREDFLFEHRFHHPDIPKSVGIRGRRWVYARYFEQDPVYEQLFDLVQDPKEFQNLAQDPKFAEVLAGQRARCDALLKQN